MDSNPFFTVEIQNIISEHTVKFTVKYTLFTVS